MKRETFFVALLAAAAILAASAAFAQRLQFGTQVDAPPAGGSVPAAGAAPVAPTYAPPAPTYTAPPAAPAMAPSPPPLMPAPAGASSANVAPALTTPPPGYAPAPTYTPPAGMVPPAAAPGAGVQPPPAAWDPYAAPGNAPGCLLPQDPCLPNTPTMNVATVQKFLQHIDLNYDWFAGNGANELGINDVSLSATFAFPIFFNAQTPLLVTPGFAAHYWAGPVSVLPAGPPPQYSADMPPQTFDAYLDVAWNPWITEYFGAELDARVGVYSDFYSVTSDSLRVTGKGLAVIRLSPHMVLKAGVWYLNRVSIQLLPAGGLVWTPTPDICFEILFPNPRVSKRLRTLGNTEWWLYGRGDYGGGVWTIRRNPDAPNFYNMSHDVVDYDDIRIALGLEFKTLRQLNGYCEVGFACDRQLNYQSSEPPAYYPNNTVFIGAGLSY